MKHECQYDKAEAYAQQHREDADDILHTRSLCYAPCHAEGCDTIAEMETCSNHSKQIKDEYYWIRQIAVQQSIIYRMTHYTLQIYAKVEDMPYKEYHKIPCCPALKSELPVADISIMARIVLCLESYIDAVDTMEKQWNCNASNLKAVEDWFWNKLHHRKSRIQALRSKQCSRVSEDVLEKHGAQKKQSAERMQTAHIKCCVHSVPPNCYIKASAYDMEPLRFHRNHCPHDR